MTSDIQVKQDIKSLLDSEALKKSLEKSFSSEGKRVAFRTSVLSLVNQNEMIAKCEPLSVINSALQASTLDLPINQNLGFAYIVPYFDTKKGQYFAQFQMGTKGFIQLALRTNQFRTINVTDVREGEIKSFDRLSGDIVFEWILDEDVRNERAVVGYVSFMELLNGFKKLKYMTVKDLQAHGMKYSQTMKKGFGLWKDDFDAMARKTVLKLLLDKYAPKSVEMQTAVEIDQAVLVEGKVTYPDNTPESLEERNRRIEEETIFSFIKNAESVEQLEQFSVTVPAEKVTDEMNQAYEERLADLTAKEEEQKLKSKKVTK